MGGIPELNTDESQLYALVPLSGETISNPVVQGQLDWPDEKYWKVRDALVDRGLVVRGRGRGGTLKRVVEEAATDTVTVPVSPQTGEPTVREWKQRSSVKRRCTSPSRRSSPAIGRVTAGQTCWLWRLLRPRGVAILAGSGLALTS